MAEPPKSQVVKFISHVDGDGVADPTIEHIPYRQITFNQGEAPVVYGSVPQDKPDAPDPATDNLYTCNQIVPAEHLFIICGSQPRTIHVKPLKAVPVTSLEGRVLPPGEDAEVVSGQIIQIGENPLTQDGRIIAYPPRFEVQIMPLSNPPPQSMNAIIATLAAKSHDGKLQ